jgi:hypothetical protein
LSADAFAVSGGLNWWREGRLWPCLGGIAVVVLLAAHLFPSALRPFNLIWFKFGLLLHAVVNPVVMGLLFYSAAMPTGLIMRAMGKDMLRLRHEPEADSYWIVRQPPGPAPESMKDQF